MHWKLFIRPIIEMQYTVFLLIPGLILLAILLLHFYFRIPSSSKKKTPAEFNLPFKEFYIPTVKNKQLFAWFIPASSTSALVIIVHGWGSNAQQMLPLALPFYHQGLNVLLFDSRSHGRSDRDTFSSLPRFAEDIQQVILYARKQLPFNNSLVLVGHSLGGSASLYTASKQHDINAVISIAAFAHPRWMMKRFLHRLPKLILQPVLFYVQWLIGHTFDEIAPVNSIKKITCPVLIAHGSEDTTVPFNDALLIHQSNPRSQLLRIAGANHGSMRKLKSHGDLLIQFLRDNKILR
jgi:pimeloyl-ACP methyl ester carboxylesterase